MDYNMKFLNKMERKLGRYAIPNLTKYIIITYIIGYALNLMQRVFSFPILYFLELDPALILHGQIWRLVSWVLIPPGQLNIFTLIMLLCYYQLGTALERTWGAFRYNVYIFFGLFMTIVGSFILYAVMGNVYSLRGYGAAFSSYYVSLSIFLGFALTYPDMQMMLYFLIPIKIKYLAVLDAVYLAADMYRGDWATRVVILSSLANVIVFFLMTRNYQRVNPQEIHRKREFQKAMSRGQASNISTHKCAICGRTEKDDPTLEFRFCSRCNGNYEYCQEHLFTHEHVR